MADPPTIYDQFGRALGRDMWGGAFDAPRDPLEGVNGRTATVIFRDIPLQSVALNWSIDAIRKTLVDHRIGLWALPSQLSDSIFGDDRVQATLGSRTGGLFSQPLVHHRRGEGRKYSHRAWRAWKEIWPKICPQSVMSEIMRWAIVLGFAIAELRWDTSVTPWIPYLKPWNPFFAMYRWDLRQYQLSTLDGPVAAVPGQGKWILFTPHGSYRGWIQGAIRAIAERWFLKQLSWRDWARFNERHGLPIIAAEVPAAGDITQKRNFIQGMQRLGQESVVGLPQNVDKTGYKVSLLEARDRAWESFPNLIDRCDRSMVLPILWQNLTTEVKEGSYAAARVHGDVRQNAIEFDNETLSEAIYQQIARPWALFNFGDPDVAPYSCWDVEPVEDFLMKTEALQKFAQSLQQLRMAGLAPKHVRRLAARFGIELGAMVKVDPVQVEARAAGVTGKADESTQSLKSAYLDVRRKVRELDAAFRKIAA
jgi:Protein of unknown function (DUF935)